MSHASGLGDTVSRNYRVIHILLDFVLFPESPVCKNHFHCLLCALRMYVVVV